MFFLDKKTSIYFILDLKIITKDIHSNNLFNRDKILCCIQSIMFLQNIMNIIQDIRHISINLNHNNHHYNLIHKYFQISKYYLDILNSKHFYKVIYHKYLHITFFPNLLFQCIMYRINYILKSNYHYKQCKYHNQCIPCILTYKAYKNLIHNNQKDIYLNIDFSMLLNYITQHIQNLL